LDNYPEEKEINLLPARPGLAGTAGKNLTSGT